MLFPHSFVLSVESVCVGVVMDVCFLISLLTFNLEKQVQI